MSWQPYREPLRTTLRRTVLIAVVAGAVAASMSGGIKWWPLTTLVMLWPSFGGHWIELWYLNWLRPRLSSARWVHVGGRVAVWFTGGLLLGLGVRLTVIAAVHRPPVWAWWVPGLAFIGIELIPHTIFQLRGRPSFCNGRG